MDRSERGFSPSLIALLPALVALGIYLATMAPSLTLAHGGSDGPELAVAVETLGIPHPTGYPTYVLLAQAFRALPGGTLAGRLNLLSALAGALTVGLTALIATELFEERHRPPALIAGLTAGLSLAGAGLFWSQALITEVYTLHCLFLALAGWLLLRWRRAGGAYLALAGLSLGLGLGNHTSLVFLLPGAVLFLILTRHRRPRWWELLLSGGLLLLGLGIYLYLPLRAAADPWLNWGDPDNWGRLRAHASAQDYRPYLFQVPWPQVVDNLSTTARWLLRDLGYWGIPLAIAGLLLLGREDRPALALTATPPLLGLLLAVTYGGDHSWAHLLPLYVAGALWAGVAGGVLAHSLQRWRPRITWVALLLPMLSVILIVGGWSRWTLRREPGPLPALKERLATLPADAVLLSDRDEATFPIWYAQVVQGIRPDLVPVDTRLLEQAWYRQQLPARYPELVVPAEPSAGNWSRALQEANPGRPVLAVGSDFP